MTFSFHPEAEAEFFDAIEYYEKCRAGLGYDFAVEIYSAIEKVVAFPVVWPVIGFDIHRCLIQRFPFGLLYDCSRKEIVIVAVMHLHRKPGYWKRRI
jgi:toxin ParE1/3/4